MDTFTHIAIGACIGELVAGRRLGKKAMLLGAMAQVLPDIDFVAALWLPPARNLLAHRGFTHSILFALLAISFLAVIASQWYKKYDLTYKRWVFFLGIQVFLHLFIDAFNAYGVGWFEPFSHCRVSFNTVFVIDPFFTIAPAVAFIVLLFSAGNYYKRRNWAAVGVSISAGYLAFCIENKLLVDMEVDAALHQQQIQYSSFFTTPTPMNNFLWYVVVKEGSGYNIGYASVFDEANKLSLKYYKRNDSLLDNSRENTDLKYLIRFSQGYYAIEEWHDTLVFNDIRFGQIAGWQDTNSKFSFHFFLRQPAANTFVVQRGRFANWNRETLMSLLDRIKGN